MCIALLLASDRRGSGDRRSNGGRRNQGVPKILSTPSCAGLRCRQRQHGTLPQESMVVVGSPQRSRVKMNCRHRDTRATFSRPSPLSTASSQPRVTPTCLQSPSSPCDSGTDWPLYNRALILEVQAAAKRATSEFLYRHDGPEQINCVIRSSFLW